MWTTRWTRSTTLSACHRALPQRALARLPLSSRTLRCLSPPYLSTPCPRRALALRPSPSRPYPPRAQFRHPCRGLPSPLRLFRRRGQVRYPSPSLLFRRRAQALCPHRRVAALLSPHPKVRLPRRARRRRVVHQHRLRRLPPSALRRPLPLSALRRPLPISPRRLPRTRPVFRALLRLRTARRRPRQRRPRPAAATARTPQAPSPIRALRPFPRPVHRALRPVPTVRLHRIQPRLAQPLPRPFSRRPSANQPSVQSPPHRLVYGPPPGLCLYCSRSFSCLAPSRVSTSSAPLSLSAG
jgi:hypothetical protein